MSTGKLFNGLDRTLGHNGQLILKFKMFINHIYIPVLRALVLETLLVTMAFYKNEKLIISIMPAKVYLRNHQSKANRDL